MQFKESSLGHRLILRPFIEKQSKGGIVIARDERSQAINTDRGEVLAIGPQCWYDLPRKPDVKHGDKVFYSKYGAKILKDDETGELYTICNDEDILVAFEGSPALEHSDE